MAHVAGDTGPVAMMGCEMAPRRKRTGTRTWYPWFVGAASPRMAGERWSPSGFDGSGGARRDGSRELSDHGNFDDTDDTSVPKKTRQGRGLDENNMEHTMTRA